MAVPPVPVLRFRVPVILLGYLKYYFVTQYMYAPPRREKRAMGDVSVVKRSARQRSGSSKVRVFDEHMRKEIKRKRLAALEQDNWHEERRVAEEDDDEDYNPLDDGDDSDGGTQALLRVRGVVVHAFLLVAHI